MKIPRDLSGSDLVKALHSLGYERARQDGSHVRLTTQRGGQHHVTVPNHSPIKLGTLTGILKAVAAHHKLTVEDLVRELGI
ncbi:MAG: type II toxin-antitoxin system HicA family toxin [Opitutaceae bacterium]|jgi:predicted RNA binding protein YcfA (HicA-like mRNA interferase family)